MFRELRDLIIEGLHLLLLYGFLCICAIGIVIMVVANLNSKTPQPLYYAVNAEQPNVKKDSSEGDLRVLKTTSEMVCNRIAGCKVFPEAPTEEEYCPTCILEK